MIVLVEYMLVAMFSHISQVLLHKVDLCYLKFLCLKKFETIFLADSFVELFDDLLVMVRCGINLEEIVVWLLI